MAKVIVGMTTSLDGFVNDRNGSVERLTRTSKRCGQPSSCAR
jgi:hypothetical protein